MILFPIPKASKTEECIIYHDESKRVLRNVWAHSLFFLPESASAQLLNKLWEARKRHGCEDIKLHFADISGGRICEEDGSIVIKEWLGYGVEALRSKGSHVFKPALNCKLGIIFFDTSLDLNLYSGETEDEKMLKYFETVLRMVLKGCAHGLYDDSNKLRIKGIVTDGLPWHRRLDESRILGRLISQARDYVTVDENAYIEAIVSNHVSCNCTDSNKAQFLQLTDLLLGSVIQCFFRELTYRSKKEIIVRPVRELFVKQKRGRGFQRSGHYRSFALSFTQLVNGRWTFRQLEEKGIIYQDNQLRLLQ
jgi:hypothetical protein